MNDVPVRDAATVVLLRDGSAGVEAWLLTRVTQMVFAAGMTAYILAAIRWEERDLVAAHPEYDTYRRRVPMLLPRLQVGPPPQLAFAPGMNYGSDRRAQTRSRCRLDFYAKTPACLAAETGRCRLS